MWKGQQRETDRVNPRAEKRSEDCISERVSFKVKEKGLTRLDIDGSWKDLHDEECQRETDDGDYVRGEWIEKKRKKKGLKVCIVKRLAGRESVNPHGAEGWIGKLLMFGFLKEKKEVNKGQGGLWY